MANHASAKKRIRQTRRRQVVNRDRMSEIRTLIKKVEKALSDSDIPGAKESLKAVQPALMRGAQKGIIHPNTAARKLSRLNTRVAKAQN